MQFSFANLGQGQWGVKASGNLGETRGLAGQTITVTKRSGEQKRVTLGAVVDSWNGGRATIYRIAREPRQAPRATVREDAKPAAQLDPGVYEVDGTVYVVKPNRQRTRLYAKRLVEINAERATEAGERVQIEFEYAPGAIYQIRPEHRMCITRAKALTIRYGRCICCGRHLRAAGSVERGIGPVCARSFRHDHAHAA